MDITPTRRARSHGVTALLVVLMLCSPASAQVVGTTKWLFDTDGGRGGSSPVIAADGTIYVGTSALEDLSTDEIIHGGSFFALNPDGTLAWEFDPGGDGGFYYDPAIGPDGTIYVPHGEGLIASLFAINPDGTVQWTWTPENEQYPRIYPPAIGPNGTIYLGTSTTTFTALNPDGSQLWAVNIACGGIGSWEPVSAPAIGSDGTIYVKAPGDYLVAIDPSGAIMWHYLLVSSPGSGLHSSPAIGEDGTIYVGSDYTPLNNVPGKVFAINPDGTLRWEFITPDRMSVHTPPVIASDGTVYASAHTSSGFPPVAIFYAINPDGTQQWEFPQGSNKRTWSSPAIGLDGTIYFASRDSFSSGEGAFVALNPDGSQAWSHQVHQWYASASAIGDDGTVYVYSSDGLLYAFFSASGGLANSPWPMRCHDTQHTGRAASTIDTVTFTVFPKKGGNTGEVTLRIVGGTFEDGTVVTLDRDGHPSIVAGPVVIQDGGVSMIATLDLTGAGTGMWSLTSLEPGSMSTVLTDEFVVEEGREPDVWFDIVGRSFARIDGVQRLNVLYGNRGNIDAPGAMLIIDGIPSTAAVATNFDLVVDPTGEASGELAPVLDTEEGKMIPVHIGMMPAGFVGVLPVDVIPVSIGNFQVRATQVAP